MTSLKLAILSDMNFIRLIKDNPLIESEQSIKLPPRYACILHNDHFTTRDFVVHVLVSIFHLDEAQAQKKMLEVHRNGQGCIGNYSYDIALTKALYTEKKARKNQFPLKCTIEPL